MCLNNLPENKILEVVNKTLADLDLDEIRDLKVEILSGKLLVEDSGRELILPWSSFANPLFFLLMNLLQAFHQSTLKLYESA